MRLPLRRSDRNKDYTDQTGPVYLTASGLKRLKQEIRSFEQERPTIVEELSRAIAMGDLSENAEYRDAKHRLARLDGRLFTLKERLARVELIEKAPPASGGVALGSKVRLETNGKETTYVLVGPQESNPSRGYLSYLSPLGSALLHKHLHDHVTIKTEHGFTEYIIQAIQ